MIKYLFAILMIPILKIDSCSKVEIENAQNQTPDIKGEYIYKYRFLGDAIDTPCGYAVTNVRDLTLKIEENTEDKNSYRISGNSAVNMLSGYLTITGYDSKMGIGTIKIGQLGSTKMAGPPELMQCEQAYFDMLNEAPEFRVQEGKLHIGRFKKDDIPSRDGGTYMIFEKIK